MMKLSPLQLRVATGLVLVFLLAVVIAMGGWTLRLAILLVSSLTLYEFLLLFWPGRQHMKGKITALVLGGLVVLSQAIDPLWTLTAIVLAWMVPALCFLFRFGSGDQEARIDAYMPIIGGALYIPLALHLALYLSPVEQCLVMLAAMAADTGGYFAGVRFGNRKLWPSVSPKKTWAGLYGGLGLCVVCCTALAGTANAMDWPLLKLPLWGWVMVSALLFLAALFGDFFESAVKRTLNIKDSGTLLPGHGGLLDRLDSTLFVLPVYTLFRLVTRILQGS